MKLKIFFSNYYRLLNKYKRQTDGQKDTRAMTLYDNLNKLSILFLHQIFSFCNEFLGSDPYHDNLLLSLVICSDYFCNKYLLVNFKFHVLFLFY